MEIWFLIKTIKIGKRIILIKPITWKSQNSNNFTFSTNRGLSIQTKRLHQSIHLHSCWESENIRGRSTSPWGQTTEITPSLPSPPQPLWRQNWTQGQNLEEGAKSWKRSWQGQERGCKREGVGDNSALGRVDTGDMEQTEEIREATPYQYYSVDSVLVKKYHLPKVPLEHSAWFHVGVWPVNGNAILFYFFPFCFRLYHPLLQNKERNDGFIL